MAYVTRSNFSWRSVFHSSNYCERKLTTLDAPPASDLLDSNLIFDGRCEQSDEGMFSWMRILLHLSDEEIQQKAGLHSVIFLRFYRYLIYYTGFTMLVCLLIILPVNMTGNYNSRQIHMFGVTTITNIPYNSNALWIHLLCGFSFFTFAIFLMGWFARSLRLIHQTVPRLMDKTVMVSHINPKNCKPELMMNYFDRAYPGVEIMDIQYAYNVRKLIKLDSELQSAISAIEYSRNYTKKKRARMQILPHTCGITAMSFRSAFRFCLCCRRRRNSFSGDEEDLPDHQEQPPRILCCPCCGCNKHTEDATEFYTSLSSELLLAIAYQRKITLQKPIGVAFITFGSPIYASKFVRDHSYIWCAHRRRKRSYVSRRLRSNTWHVEFSPTASSFIWQNFTGWRNFYWAKIILLNIAVFAMAFFLTTPLYFFNLFTRSNIMKQLSSKNKLIFQILPTIILWLTSVLLPLLVIWTDKWSMHWTKATKHFMTMAKTVAMLLLMVLILPSLGFTSLAGIFFWNDNSDIDNNNTNTIVMTGKARFHWECIFMPDNSAYFVNYVITYGFIGSSVNLFRIFDLIRYSIRRSFLRSAAETSRAYTVIMYEFDFGLNYAYLLCVFCIITSYSILCPIITPFGLFCLCMRFAVTRYNIYFAYLPSVTDSRVHWLAMTFMLLGVLLLQLNLFVFILIRRSFSTSLLVVCTWILFVTSVVCFCVYIPASWVYIDRNRRLGNKMFTLSDVIPEDEPLMAKPSAIFPSSNGTQKIPTFAIAYKHHTRRWHNSNTNQVNYTVEPSNETSSNTVNGADNPVQHSSPVSPVLIV